MIVGAFPPPGSRIFGGVVTSCRLLLQSSLPQRARLVLIDSTQVSNPPPGLPTRAWLALVRTMRFVVRFEQERPDAVLLFCSAGGSLLEKGCMAWYSRLRGVAALLFPRDGNIFASGSGRIGRTWLRMQFAGAAMVLCQGPAWRRFATEILRFPEERCPLVPNWSATPALLAIGRDRVPQAGRPVECLFVGWVEPEKGVHEMLEAFSRIAPARNVRLHIVGDGHAMATVREFIAISGLQARIRVSGWLHGDEVLEAYRQADILILPSWAEGLPNSMIEAMAAGLAVIVTRVGNVPDVVVDRREALLVPPKDVDGLAAALAEIIDDSALRAKLAHAGHELAGREFAVESAVTRILNAVGLVRDGEGGTGSERQGMNSCAE